MAEMVEYLLRVVLPLLLVAHQVRQLGHRLLHWAHVCLEAAAPEATDIIMELLVLAVLVCVVAVEVEADRPSMVKHQEQVAQVEMVSSALFLAIRDP
jgi:hypothetical protein